MTEQPQVEVQVAPPGPAPREASARARRLVTDPSLFEVLFMGLGGCSILVGVLALSLALRAALAGGVLLENLILIVMLPFGLLFFLVAFVPWRRRDRVFRWATPALARAEGYRSNPEVWVGRSTAWELKWSFDARGAVFSGTLNTFLRRELQPLADRGTFWVLYDEQSPWMNVLYVP
jgi:hypothetical protein